MSAGINKILIISTSQDILLFKKLLSDGKKYGCNFYYEIQENPNGIAEAFIIGKNFVEKDKVALILGDNVFYGLHLSKLLKANTNVDGAAICAYYVHDPDQYGVIEFDEKFNAISIEEKPVKPKSNFAVTGIYFYDNSVLEVARTIKPSARGKLTVTILDKGITWLDTGTFGSLLKAGKFVEGIEEKQGLKVGSVEEAAFRSGFITKEQMRELAMPFLKSGYGTNLMKL